MCLKTDEILPNYLTDSRENDPILGEKRKKRKIKKKGKMFQITKTQVIETAL